MTWHLLEPITVYRAACKHCHALLEDTDPQRLGREMDAHEQGGCG